MLSELPKEDLKELEVALVCHLSELEIQLTFKVPGAEESIARTNDLILMVRHSQELQGM